jgi:hypothetical protein
MQRLFAQPVLLSLPPHQESTYISERTQMGLGVALLEVLGPLNLEPIIARSRHILELGRSQRAASIRESVK